MTCMHASRRSENSKRARWQSWPRRPPVARRWPLATSRPPSASPAPGARPMRTPVARSRLSRQSSGGGQRRVRLQGLRTARTRTRAAQRPTQICCLMVPRTRWEPGAGAGVTGQAPAGSGPAQQQRRGERGCCSAEAAQFCSSKAAGSGHGCGRGATGEVQPPSGRAGSKAESAGGHGEPSTSCTGSPGERMSTELFREAEEEARFP